MKIGTSSDSVLECTTEWWFSRPYNNLSPARSIRTPSRSYNVSVTLLFGALLFRVTSSTCHTELLAGMKPLHYCLRAHYCSIIRRHWPELTYGRIYCVNNSCSRSGIEDKKSSHLLRSLLHLFNFPLSVSLSFEINGTNSEISLLLYFRISYSTYNANLNYTGEIVFSYLSVVWRPLVFVSYEQERNSLFVFVKHLLSVSRRNPIPSRYTTDAIISFIATAVSSSVFL